MPVLGRAAADGRREGDRCVASRNGQSFADLFWEKTPGHQISVAEGAAAAFRKCFQKVQTGSFFLRPLSYLRVLLLQAVPWRD